MVACFQAKELLLNDTDNKKSVPCHCGIEKFLQETGTTGAILLYAENMCRIVVFVVANAGRKC